MKRSLIILIPTFFVLIFVVLFACSNGTRIIDNPKVEAASESLKLKQVTLTDSSTVLLMTVKVPEENWIRIASTAHIVADGRKFHLTGIDGLVADEKFFPEAPDGYDVTLIFPAIPSGVSTIDFREGPNRGQWFISGIAI